MTHQPIADKPAEATATFETGSAPGAVTVRRAGIQDATIVRTMLLELATHENTAYAVHATTDDWRRSLANPAVVVLLAFVGEAPVGYVSGIRQLNLWTGGDIFAMDDLYVRADARDRGIGGQLMAALAEHVADDQLLITWGVREDNDAGHRFYRRLGATLRTKIVAAWQPGDYGHYLDNRRDDDRFNQRVDHGSAGSKPRPLSRLPL